MIRHAAALGALLAALVPGRAHPAEPNPLVAPTRCVGDYLEAVAAAAPPRSKRARGPPGSAAGDARWARARAFLAPPPPGGAPRVSPSADLGPDGAFLGYELVRVRRAPGGAAVVTAVERTIRSAEATPASTACAYLVARIAGAWRIADRRCGRDFSDADVLARREPGWDAPEPAPGPSGAERDESLPDDPE